LFLLRSFFGRELGKAPNMKQLKKTGKKLCVSPIL